MVQIAYASAAGNGFIQHRAAGHLFHVLAEIADREPPGNGDFALVWSFLAHNHAEKRGLTRAIRPHQTDFFARIELEGSVHKNQLPAVLFIDIGKRDHPCFQANRNRADA